MSYKDRLPRETRFLVTSITRFELDSASEVWHALRATGVCKNAEVFFIKRKKKRLQGLFGVIFNKDPIYAIEKVKQYLMDHPWVMKFTQRIIPIEYVANNVQDLVYFVEKTSSSKISDNDAWKIQVRKHYAKISKNKLIEEIANVIKKGHVNLIEPTWVINIEVVIDTYAASIIRPNQVIKKKELIDKEKI